MSKFLLLFRRFLPPYKKYVVASLLMNLLSTVFSLFSFFAIIPVLQILFGIDKSAIVYQQWAWSDSFSQIASALKNNVYYGIEQMVQQAGDNLALVYIGAFLVVMTAFKVGTAYLAAYYIIPIRTGIVRDLRNKLFKKVVSLPLGFFSEERKGDIMSRTMSDVSEVEASIISSLEMIFKNPVMIIIYLAVMFAMSWKLSIFVLLLLPFSGWLVGIIGRKLRTASKKGQEQTGFLLSQLDETLGGLRVVKAFNAESKVEKRFANTNEQIRTTFNKIFRRFNLAHPISEQIGTTVIAILIWFGGTLIVGNNGALGPDEFIYYLVIFYSIIAPAKDLSKAGYSVQKGMASLERIDTILNAENLITEPRNAETISVFRDKIEFRNVFFKYKNDWVLQDISLTVEKGKTIAFVGQSGSGKSTLVDLVERFYDVQQGEILVDGKNVKSLTTHNLRSLLGMVNQEAILFNDSFFNNIAFGVENATIEQVTEAAKIANAHDFIMATENGYNSNIGDRGGKLSGGQRQRISIARAILKNPPILILDEATSALDTESERLVQDALERLMENRTTLVVAHRLSTIKKADEICVIHEGRIVERGKHDELIALGGAYKKLVDMQSF
ncbi:MAG: ABC transporter ATP-binding protein/permease [Paludibacter sp.]|jgi:ABC-type multidrug transport system fused ATPase/permease subunit|nr:ABC transporter ATP-binding protein/permease [Paludibacter sp.]